MHLLYKKQSIVVGARSVLLVLMVGCGLAHPKPKKQIEVPLEHYPEYPTQSNRGSFTLTSGENNQIAYTTGTILILNPALSAEDLASMLTYSKEVRLAREDAKSYVLTHEARFNELESEQLQLTQARTTLLREALKRSVSDIETQMVTAKSWFEDEVLSRIADATDRSAKKEIWASYCEAKIWQLAAQPSFAKLRYLKRPSPLSLCEGYYAEKKFFDPQSEECSEGVSPAGKSYVSCLWRQGVMLTAIYKSQIEAKSGVDLAQLLGADKLDDFIAILAEAKGDKQGKPLVGRRFSIQFYDKILNLEEFGAPGECNKDKVVFYMKYPSLCSMFKRTLLVDEEKLLNLSPKQLIDYVENGAITINTVKTELKLPSVADVASLTSPGKSATYDELIKFFARRETKAQQSESDAIFHVVAPDSLAADALNPNVLTRMVLPPSHPGMSDEAKGAFKAVFGTVYAALLPEDVALLNHNKVQQQDMKSEQNRILGEKSRREKVVEDITKEASLAANRPNLAYAFFSAILKVTRAQDLYTMELTLDNNKKSVKACLNATQGVTLAASECLDKPLLQVAADRLTYNAATGEFRFAFKLDNLSEIGYLEPVAPVNGVERNSYFNDLPYSALNGKTMEFQLFPNNLDGVLNLMTGKVWVKRAGWIEGDDYDYEGVVSLFD